MRSNIFDKAAMAATVVRVCDLRASVSWYRDKLGLEPIHVGEDGPDHPGVNPGVTMLSLLAAGMFGSVSCWSDADDLIDRGNWSIAGVLSGVTAIGESCCGHCDQRRCHCRGNPGELYPVHVKSHLLQTVTRRGEPWKSPGIVAVFPGAAGTAPLE